MKNKLKNKIVSALLVFVIASAAFFNPILTPRAEAFGLPVMNVPEFVKDALSVVAQIIANKMTDQMVKDTVSWAQDGFEGNPAFVNNFGQELGNAANDAAGNYLNEQVPGLCSPFRPQIILGLQQSYTGTSPSESSSCSFTGIKGNLEDFYSDFGNGGWQGWFSMTQNDSNNPYGAFLNAQTGLSRKVATKVGMETKQLDWSRGFRTPTECLAKNPDQATLDAVHRFLDQGFVLLPGKYEGTLDYKGTVVNKDKGALECIAEGDVKTPGALIQGALQNTFASPLNKIISAQQINQLISAFASGLLNRYVFGPEGLLSKGSNKGETKNSVDLDKDGIPDGYDFDDDGSPDACLHGLVDPDQLPSTTNCLRSSQVASSPFFSPLCQRTSEGLASLHTFYNYITTNTFNKNLSRIWLDKVGFAQEGIENITNAITHLEINNRSYDKTLNTLGSYSKYLDKSIDSLAEDEDLGDKGFVGTGLFGSTSDNDVRKKIISETKKIIDYLEQFNNVISQKCDNPDENAINQIDAPIIDSGSPDSTVGDYDSSWVPAYLAQHNLTGSCTITDAGKNIKITPDLSTLDDLDIAPMVSYGSISADIILIKDGRRGLWQIQCTNNTNGTSTSGTTGTGNGGGSNTGGSGSGSSTSVTPSISSYYVSPTQTFAGSNVTFGFTSNLSTFDSGASCSISDNSGKTYTDSSGSTFVSGMNFQTTVNTTTTFTFSCRNQKGSDSKSATVTIIPDEYKGEPVITSFRASPNPVNSGQPVTFSWTANHATSCWFGRDYDGGSGSASFVETDIWGNVARPGTYTHVLTCYNKYGGQYSNSTQSTQVIVQ